VITVEPPEVESLDQLKVTWKIGFPMGASDWIGIYQADDTDLVMPFNTIMVGIKPEGSSVINAPFLANSYNFVLIHLDLTGATMPIPGWMRRRLIRRLLRDIGVLVEILTLCALTDAL
jgi:hypothetical protein